MASCGSKVLRGRPSSSIPQPQSSVLMDLEKDAQAVPHWRCLFRPDFAGPTVLLRTEVTTRIRRIPRAVSRGPSPFWWNRIRQMDHAGICCEGNQKDETLWPVRHSKMSSAQMGIHGNPFASLCCVLDFDIDMGQHFERSPVVHQSIRF